MTNIVNTPSLPHNRHPGKAKAHAPAVQMVVPKPFYDSYCGLLSDEQFYFIHLLGRKMLEARVTHEYINLNIQILSRQLGSKPRERQIQHLIDLGSVEVQSTATSSESYLAGKRGKGYRLNESLRKAVLDENIVAYWSAQGSTLSRRLKRLWMKLREEAIQGLPLLKREYDWIKKLSFDSQKAEDYKVQFEANGTRGDLPFTKRSSIRLDSDVFALSKLNEGDFLYTFNGTRLTTVITGAMREMRKCLNDSRGESMVELDLRSSQIVFLCKALLLYREHFVKSNFYSFLMSHLASDVDLVQNSHARRDDISVFIQQVITGDIYAELYHLEAGFNSQWTTAHDGTIFKSSSRISRDKFLTKDRGSYKKQVLADLLFNYYTRTKNIPTLALAFEESYPNVVGFLKSIAGESRNERRSVDLAEVTQAYESYFFHGVGLDSLVQAYPDREFYIVHDCIGVPEDIEDEAKSILNQALYKHLGIPENHQLVREDSDYNRKISSLNVFKSDVRGSGQTNDLN
jgi:hypothetical protein